MRKYLNYIIFGLVVLAVVGLAFSHSRHVRGLVTDMTSGTPQAQEAAAAELIKAEQFGDTVTGEPIPTRLKAAESLEVLGNSTGRTGEGVIKSSDAIKQLLALLKDLDKPVRDRAVVALQHVGAKSADNLKEFVNGLKDGDANIRKGTITALTDTQNGIGPQENPDVIAAVVDIMKREGGARGPGGDVLSSPKFETPVARSKSAQALLALLEDKDGDVRGGAADALGKLGDPVAVPRLKKAITDDASMQVRRIAVGAIALIADPSGEDALVSAVKDKNADNEARLQAATGLGKIASSTAISTLVDALRDEDLKLRSSAVSALARAYRPKTDGATNAPALNALTTALKSGDTDTQVGAAQSLKLILTEAAGRNDTAASQAANQVLFDALKSSDADVRMNAASALGAAGNAPAIPELMTALADNSGDVSGAARDALAAIGPQATEALVTTMQKGGTTAFYASQALAQQGETVLPALKQAAQSTNPVSQRWAAVTLGDLPTASPEASTLLKQLASSSDPDVAYVAKTQLSRLGQSSRTQ